MPDTAIIAALSALTGVAIGSVSTFLIARKNLKKEISLKMAEYRLSWINNLGDQFAEFSATIYDGLFSTDDARLLDIYYKMRKSVARVKNLMNHKDANFEKLMTCMDELRVASTQDGRALTSLQKDEFNMLMNKFDRVSNDILKSEWRKLKNNLKEDTVEVAALRSETRSN